MGSMFEDQLGLVLTIFSYTWWLFVLAFIFIFIRDFVFKRNINKHIDSIDWVVLEINLPGGNVKPLKAMEQVFASLYGTFTFGILKRDRFLKGEVEPWMAFEIVGFSKSIHFYARVQKGHRKLVEAAFLSQYPDMEIVEVEDYTKLLPNDIPNKNYDIFGSDLILSKNDVYPIKSHTQFESGGVGDDEVKNIDPLATIAEVMSHLNENELVWLQYLIRPTDESWAKAAKATVDELQGKSKKKKSGFGSIVGGLGEFLQNLSTAAFNPPEWTDKSSDSPTPAGPLMPGAQETIKAVQNKISKNAFEAVIRFIYIDDKNAFTMDNAQAVLGAMRQFSSSQNLNAFRPNSDTITSKKAIRKLPINRKAGLLKRKKMLYQSYINRSMPQGLGNRFGLNSKTIILNIEEMATVFHPPIKSVRAPGLQQLDSHKGEAPINLPTRD